MISTSRQLKALVRNMSGSDSAKAQIIIRAYAMERFLERLSMTKFRDSFVIKGGVLLSSMVGLEHRATMDIDATVKEFTLTVQSARNAIEEIFSVQVEDGMSFEIKDVSPILEETDYGGVRLSVEAHLESMRTPMKIDISTGDIITPSEVMHTFGLMFEDRSISLLAYNIETVLAEKLETIISRSVANTRMRDFYDIYILQKQKPGEFKIGILAQALKNTSKARGSWETVLNWAGRLDDIAESTVMRELWEAYRQKFEFAQVCSWGDVLDSINSLFSKIIMQ